MVQQRDGKTPGSSEAEAGEALARAQKVTDGLLVTTTAAVMGESDAQPTKPDGTVLKEQEKKLLEERKRLFNEFIANSRKFRPDEVSNITSIISRACFKKGIIPAVLYYTNQFKELTKDDELFSKLNQEEEKAVVAVFSDNTNPDVNFAFQVIEGGLNASSQFERENITQTQRELEWRITLPTENVTYLKDNFDVFRDIIIKSELELTLGDFISKYGRNPSQIIEVFHAYSEENKGKRYSIEIEPFIKKSLKTISSAVYKERQKLVKPRISEEDSFGQEEVNSERTDKRVAAFLEIIGKQYTYGDQTDNFFGVNQYFLKELANLSALVGTPFPDVFYSSDISYMEHTLRPSISRLKDNHPPKTLEGFVRRMGLPQEFVEAIRKVLSKVAVINKYDFDAEKAVDERTLPYSEWYSQKIAEEDRVKAIRERQADNKADAIPYDGVLTLKKPKESSDVMSLWVIGVGEIISVLDSEGLAKKYAVVKNEFDAAHKREVTKDPTEFKIALAQIGEDGQVGSPTEYSKDEFNELIVNNPDKFREAFTLAKLGEKTGFDFAELKKGDQISITLKRGEAPLVLNLVELDNYGKMHFEEIAAPSLAYDDLLQKLMFSDTKPKIEKDVASPDYLNMQVGDIIRLPGDNAIYLIFSWMTNNDVILQELGSDGKPKSEELRREKRSFLRKATIVENEAGVQANADSKGETPNEQSAVQEGPVEEPEKEFPGLTQAAKEVVKKWFGENGISRDNKFLTAVNRFLDDPKVEFAKLWYGEPKFTAKYLQKIFPKFDFSNLYLGQVIEFIPMSADAPETCTLIYDKKLRTGELVFIAKDWSTNDRFDRQEKQYFLENMLRYRYAPWTEPKSDDERSFDFSKLEVGSRFYFEGEQYLSYLVKEKVHTTYEVVKVDIKPQSSEPDTYRVKPIARVFVKNGEEARFDKGEVDVHKDFFIGAKMVGGEGDFEEVEEEWDGAGETSSQPTTFAEQLDILEAKTKISLEDLRIFEVELQRLNKLSGDDKSNKALQKNINEQIDQVAGMFSEFLAEVSSKWELASDQTAQNTEEATRIFNDFVNLNESLENFSTEDFQTVFIQVRILTDAFNKQYLIESLFNFMLEDFTDIITSLAMSGNDSVIEMLKDFEE